MKRTCIYENNAPANCDLRATFLGKFEKDGRWYMRVRPIYPNDRLQRLYDTADIQLNPEIIIKMPYRYKKFSFYVSKDGVPSSVYEMNHKDEITTRITMTNISDETIQWKCNDINIKTVYNA